LLKAILEKYLPKSIWDLPKSGFAVPLKHWFKYELYDYSKEVILDKSVLGYNHDVAAKIIEHHKLGIRDNNHLIWALISFALWSKNG
jgi:asparagine synthase (glutamine-hydrolysing)